MLKRLLSLCCVAFLLMFSGSVKANPDSLQSHDSKSHAMHRRLGMSVFDLFSPQGQAQRMLHCLGEGPSQHADTDKVISWMQSNPPSKSNADPNALFSLNPQDWGFHGFKKRSGHSMNNWKREGKPAELQKRLQTYKEKLQTCNDRLKSDVNAANANQGSPKVQTGQNNATPKTAPQTGSLASKEAAQGAADSKQVPQQGNSASATGSSAPSPDGKPKAPGLGAQQPGVTPVMDPDQKLLPQPGGKTASSTPVASTLSSSTDDPSAVTKSSTGCDQIIDRPEYGSLSVEQKTAFVAAVMCVRNKPTRYNQDGMNAFDDWVLLHIQMLKYVHFTAYFLVFHRAMLAVVEKDLRDCGMPFGLPWVDWTKYAADGSQAPIFDPNPDYGFGSNGQGTADKCPYGSGKQVMDGAFANVTFNAPFHHSLCREFNNMDVQQPNPHWGNNCTTFLTDRFNAGLQTAHNEGKYFDFASALEISSHTAVHTCLGGNMPWLSSSANDLTFYVHHGFVDRQFSLWQSRSASNKYAFQGPKKQTKNGARPPWDATANDVMNLKPLGANVKVSDVLDHQGGEMDGLMCYRYTS